MTPAEADAPTTPRAPRATTSSAPTSFPSARTTSRSETGDYDPGSELRGGALRLRPAARQAARVRQGHGVPGRARRRSAPAARRPARASSRCRRASWSWRPSASPNQPRAVKRFFVIEDDSELSGTEIKNPKQNFDPNTQAPLVTMEFTDKGREAFARVTKRIAAARLQRSSRRARARPASRPSSASRSRSTTRSSRWRRSTTSENPEGIDGRTGAQIENIGTIQETQDLAESLRIGALPIELKLISQTPGVGHARPAGARPGPHSPAASGLALTILFLLALLPRARPRGHRRAR